jgi:membrane protein
VLIGPDAATRVASWLGTAPIAVWLWSLLRWPVMLFLVILGVDLVYHFAPNRRGRWSWITPGSLLATLLWILISFAFKFYVVNFGTYTATYGAIGGIIVTMLWFYVSSLAILVGAECNGVIDHSFRTEPLSASRTSAPRGLAVPEAARRSPAKPSNARAPDRSRNS